MRVFWLIVVVTRYAAKLINLILAGRCTTTKLSSFHLGYFPIYLSYKPCKFVFFWFCLHCFKKEPRNNRKIWILQCYPKDVCPASSESSFFEKVCFLRCLFLRVLGILEKSRWSHAIIMTCETISSTLQVFTGQFRN